MPSYPRLGNHWRQLVASRFHLWRRPLVYLRQQERERLPRLKGWRREAFLRTAARLRRETRLLTTAVRQLLHELFG